MIGQVSETQIYLNWGPANCENHNDDEYKPADSRFGQAMIGQVSETQIYLNWGPANCKNHDDDENEPGDSPFVLERFSRDLVADRMPESLQHAQVKDHDQEERDGVAGHKEGDLKAKEKSLQRQRDRETERQRDRETERQRDRETERQRDRETE